MGMTISMRHGKSFIIKVETWGGIEALEELKAWCRKYDNKSWLIDPTTGEDRPTEWLNN